MNSLLGKVNSAITAIALLTAVSGYSDGEIDFAGNALNFKQVIYTAAPGNTGTLVSYGGYTTSELQGSTAAAPETPTGTTVYVGALLTGAGYDAELLGAAGAGDALGQLVPLLTASGNAAILNFYPSGLAAGTIQGFVQVVVPGTGADGGPATMAIAVWNNEGGTVASLAAAQAYSEANPGSDTWGISALANITSTVSPEFAAAMSTASDLNLSFSLGSSVDAVPEPNTIALGVIGVSALLFRRNKRTVSPAD